jgi:hypothetical protein
VGVHGDGSLLFDEVLDTIVIEVEIVHIVTKVFKGLVEVETKLPNREDLPVFIGEHTFDEVAVRVAPVVEVGGEAECVCGVCHRSISDYNFSQVCGCVQSVESL